VPYPKHHAVWLDDSLIAVVDGLRGFPEAIEAAYPDAQIQTCIVHLIYECDSLTKNSGPAHRISDRSI
jgi:transposase-like protein